MWQEHKNMNSDIAQILIVPKNIGFGQMTNFEVINSNKYLLNESPGFKNSPSTSVLIGEQNQYSPPTYANPTKNIKKHNRNVILK